MGKLIVRYEVEGDKMPDNCVDCPVIKDYFERCPLDIWYWKAGDFPLLYAKYKHHRHGRCPLVLEDD